MRMFDKIIRMNGKNMRIFLSKIRKEEVKMRVFLLDERIMETNVRMPDKIIRMMIIKKRIL